MHGVVRYFGLVVAILGGMLLGSSAFAQGNDTRVIVPDLPGGAIVSGCYRANGRIYGNYAFEFCLRQRGTYTVTGGGVRCNGRLDWTGRGAQVSVQLRRTSCGNGVAWTADTMTCRPNLVLGPLGADPRSEPAVPVEPHVQLYAGAGHCCADPVHRAARQLIR